MSILLPFPVVDWDPSFQKIHTNYTANEIPFFTGGITFTLVGKFIRNRIAKVKAPYYTSLLSGIAFGVFCSHYSIKYQFQGYLPNDELIEKYGIRTEDEVLSAYRIANEPYIAAQSFQTQKYPMLRLAPTYLDGFISLRNSDLIDTAKAGVFAVGASYFMFGFLPKRMNLPSANSPVPFRFYLACFIVSLMLQTGKNSLISYERLLGLSENKEEEEEIGLLDENLLLEELFELRFPFVDFEEINWEDVLLTDQAIDALKLAMEARYSTVDLSHISFDKLKKHNGFSNPLLAELLDEAGYDVSDFLLAEIGHDDEEGAQESI